MRNIIEIGIFLILIGFVLVFIGTVLSSQNVAFGGLIMIGPVPIAFGSPPWVTIAAMVIGVLLMLAYFMLRRRNA